MIKDNITSYIKKFLRRGYSYNKVLEELKHTEFWTEAELIKLQNCKLEKIIRHCYKNVPFYTDLFNGLKLKPDDIKTRKDLSKLPFIDKFVVRDNFDKFIAKNKPKWLANKGHTSGTSGTPCKYLRDYSSINFENAALWRQWGLAGDKGFKRITLRGCSIVPVAQTEPPFWTHNYADNELIMSSYHLSERYADAYIAKIKDFNPQILYATPSAAFVLGKMFQYKNQKICLKNVFTSSENLSEYYKKFIEDIFSCKVFDWYGQAERVSAIAHCEKGNYHIVEDYSITETIPHEFGHEVVGTQLHNYIMPLIRYKTGDIIKLSTEKCSCGRNFRLVEEISGRDFDYIITPEGAKNTMYDLIPRKVENLIEAQFIQEKIGELIIKIVTNHDFSEKDREKLISNTLEYTSPTMKIIIKETDYIPRSPNGKFISIINKV